MLTLSVDTTAKTASVALSDGKLLGMFSVNDTLTHSENLIYMIDALLSASGKTPSEVERVAVSVGPGSFTGVRIGVAAVKGFVFGKDIPIAPVSTLEALAYNAAHTDFLICAAMDARRDQTYFALFNPENGVPVRLTEDSADGISVCCEKICEFSEKIGKKSVIFVGDGAILCYNAFVNGNYGISAELAPEHIRFQNGASVGAAGEYYFANGKTVSGKELACAYLRKPQAELAKKGEK